MANKFLTSTTEIELTKALGDDAIMSTLPETKGADILLYSSHGLFGWQRKSLPSDFVSSFTDGRLARAIPLIKENCVCCRIVCEGKFSYYPDGTLDMGRRKDKSMVNTRIKRAHVKNMVNDIEVIHDVKIDWTDDLKDTAFYLRSFRAFIEGNKHFGLFKRPSAKGLWPVPTSRDIDLWLLQSFPGIGPSVADAIINRFGGQIPLKWTCSFDELLSVPRVTQSTARTMWESLPTSSPLPANLPPKNKAKQTPSEDALLPTDLSDSIARLRGKLGKNYA